MKKTKIVILDDEKALVTMLERYLISNGYEVSSVHSALEFTELLKISSSANENPVVYLIDLSLPDAAGFNLLKELRNSQPNSAILIISGTTELADKIVGLEIGADDFISKPFELRELLARIRSVSRRTENEALISKRNVLLDNTNITLNFENWSYDVRKRALYSHADNTNVKITSLESLLLLIFLKSENALVSKSVLASSVFMREWSPQDRSLDILVSKLRKKLGDKNLILSERGRGYRFIPNVICAEQ